MTMRVLITGGAGFIGSHLAEEYINKGDEVYIIDDFSTGSPDNIAAIKQSTESEDKLFFHKGPVHDGADRNL